MATLLTLRLFHTLWLLPKMFNGGKYLAFLVRCLNVIMISHVFLMGHSRPLFLYFRLFCKQLPVDNCSIKVASDWIRTRVFWYRKQPRCQLCHNHCPAAVKEFNWLKSRGPWWWSACSPSTPTIRVRIPLKPTVFSVKLCLKRTKINKKRPGLACFFETGLVACKSSCFISDQHR